MRPLADNDPLPYGFHTMETKIRVLFVGGPLDRKTKEFPNVPSMLAIVPEAGVDEFRQFGGPTIVKYRLVSSGPPFRYEVVSM